MKNKHGDTVYPEYEVALQDHVAGSVEDDFESVGYTPAEDYRDAVRVAKRLSEQYNEPDHRVRIVCFFQDEDSSYNQVWYEYYSHGRKECRVEF